jgi:hypothetical protein
MTEFETRLDAVLVKPLVINRETFSEHGLRVLPLFGLSLVLTDAERHTMSRTRLFVGQSDTNLPMVNGS